MALNVNDPTSLAQYLASIGLHTGTDGSGNPLPPDPRLVTWLEHETAASGGGLSGLNGFNFGQVSNVDQFYALIGYADAFAATTGWSHYPNASELTWLMNNAPQGGWDQQNASAAFYARMPANLQQQYQGSRFTMDNQTYSSTVNGFISQWAALTGNETPDMNLVNQAISENWTGQRFQDFMKNNAYVKSIAPWMAHNMDYKQWQAYKEENRQAIQSRYGYNMVDNEQAYLANLQNPLYKFNAQSAQTPAGQQTGQTNQAHMGQPTYASGVR